MVVSNKLLWDIRDMESLESRTIAKLGVKGKYRSLQMVVSNKLLWDIRDMESLESRTIAKLGVKGKQKLTGAQGIQ